MKRLLHHLHRTVVLLTAVTVIVAVLAVAPAMAKAKHPKTPVATQAICLGALDKADDMGRNAGQVFQVTSTLLGDIGTNATANNADTTAFLIQLNTDIQTFNTSIAGIKDQVTSSISTYAQARADCKAALAK